MSEFYSDGQVTLYHGEVRDVLAQLPAGSVQCVVTSPPYWGLRDYGTATWEGGDAECGHVARPTGGGSGSSTLVGTHDRDGFSGDGQFRNTCGKCGARRIDAQLGLEPTPEAYVDAMVDVFRHVRRVLRDDGTLWLNIGDSYAAGKAGRTDHGTDDPTVGLMGNTRGAVNPGPVIQRTPTDGMKPKDLMMVPARLAIALQDDGWYLRSDIIWHKPNPMPESVTDRPTSAHEHIFLLTRSRRYYYDADAIGERSVTVGDTRHLRTDNTQEFGRGGDDSRMRTGNPTGEFRNARNVWSIATMPYKEAHFATFPPELPRRCILAGSREGDTVLDPFIGSGTTAMVARNLGRRAIGIDLNAEYLAMAKRRVGEQLALLDGAR